MSTNLPGYSKYSAAVMPLVDTERFPDAPNPKWPRTDILVPERDITRILGIFEGEIGFRIGQTSFIPKGVNGVKVYFNRNDTNSLFIVAETKRIANDYAHSLRLKSII